MSSSYTNYGQVAERSDHSPSTSQSSTPKASPAPSVAAIAPPSSAAANRYLQHFENSWGGHPNFVLPARNVGPPQGLEHGSEEGKDLEALETFAKYVQTTRLSADDALLRLQLDASPSNATGFADQKEEREQYDPRTPTPTPMPRGNLGLQYRPSSQFTPSAVATPDQSIKSLSFTSNQPSNLQVGMSHQQPGGQQYGMSGTAPRVNFGPIGSARNMGAYNIFQNPTPPKDENVPKGVTGTPSGQPLINWNLDYLYGLDKLNPALSGCSPPAAEGDNINSNILPPVQNPSTSTSPFHARDVPSGNAAYSAMLTPPNSREKLQKYQQHISPPPTQTQGFRPMQAVLDAPARNPQLNLFAQSINNRGAAVSAAAGSTQADPSALNAPNNAKFSQRYYGMHTQGNASADHLSNDQNCALWLRNLPPNVTYNQLLSSITGIGRIWCTYINTPDYVSHNTAAAKVVFFTPSAAARFLDYVETSSPNIRGFPIKADHNRIKYEENNISSGVSRVLIITGEAWFVNEASLTAWFAEMFVFQVDQVIEIVTAGGRAVVEFRFGSYRCQAQMGKMSLERNMPKGFQWAEFGNDPCEMGETLDSYRTATQRIQGIPPKA